MSEVKDFIPFHYSYVTSTSGHSYTTDINKDVSERPIGDDDISRSLDTIKRMRKELLMEEGKILEKGLKSEDPDILIKATKHWEDVQARVDSGVKTTVIDPYEFRDSMGFKNKPSGMPFGIMRRMSNTPMIKAVITTRQTQVSAFASPQKSKYETGFVIEKKKKFFSSEIEEVTDEDRVKMDEIARFLLNGGVESNAWDGDTFDTFLKKIVEDSLTLDQATFEVVRNNFGEPIEFLATDSATIRVADSYDQEENVNHEFEEERGYFPKYVQVIDGKIHADYYPWELCFGIRNSTTNIFNNGYGRSELETLINIVTWMLFSDQYNGNFFSQGAAPKGFLKVSGNVNSNRIQEFRQQWMSMVAGVQNAWKVPIIESDKMEWIDLQTKNTDMQFSQWQEYLLKVICSVYKISPEELGFKVGAGGGGGSMFEGGDESKLKYSRDKGLIPLLKSIEFWINKWIVNAIDPEFQFRFVGMDVDSEKDALELDIKRASTFMGLKEVRRKNDMPEEIDKNDIILNAVWMQNHSMMAMQEDMEGSTEVAEEEGGGVWDNLDEADDSDFNELDETEKALYEEDPFQYELNAFVKGLDDVE